MRRSGHALTVLAVPGLLFGSIASVAVAGPVSAAVCDGSGAALGNGGFETPAVAPGSNTDFTSFPPWQTTDAAGQFEIWGDGFDGVPAGEGNAFAELNATSAGTLYQDVVSTPGATMSWSLLHRGRTGDDVMEVLIGDAHVADVNGATGWGFISAGLTDGTSAWGVHTGAFVVPAGQTCTRFAFRAISSASGDPSFGNFLDAVSFSVSIPAGPTPRPSFRATSPPTSTVAAAGAADPRASLPIAALILLAAIAGLGAVLARTRPSRNGG